MKQANLAQKSPSLGSIETSEAENHLRKENENTKYQDKKRYTETKTEPIPKFEESNKTGDVIFEDEQLSFSEKMQNSSFRELYERISREQDAKILKQKPRNAKEWYYATGGIMS